MNVVYTTKVTEIGKTAAGKVIIKTQDGDFFQSYAEKHKLRPSDQTKRLYESVCIGDEIEYSESGDSLMILRNKTQDERDVKSFVEDSKQHVIVTNFWYSQDNCRTFIECFGACGKLEFDVVGHVALRLLDEIIITRAQGQLQNMYKYNFVCNVTLEQDAQRAFQEKVLRDWSKEKRALLSNLLNGSKPR